MPHQVHKQRRSWMKSLLSAPLSLAATSQGSGHLAKHLLLTGGAAAGVASGLTGCYPRENRYRQTNLAASSAKYNAKFTFPNMVNAWGIAIRPSGAGGHFWVTAGGTSWQFVGDIQQSPQANLRTLFQDGLREVYLPGADSRTDNDSIGKSTGTVFNGAPLTSDLFRVTTQTAMVNGQTVRFDGSARFIFVTDSGVVSAWTDRASDGTVVRVDGPAAEVFNGADQGMAFFGVAIHTGNWNRLWLADFGRDPQIRTLNERWELIPTEGFINPFATGELRNPANPELGKKPKPGDPVPFNVQTLGKRVFVTYCMSQPDPNSPAAFYAAEEDAVAAEDETRRHFLPNKGKVVEYDLNGQLKNILFDGGRLNAPWGIVETPPDFGLLSNCLLVGNFGGNGTIAAYDRETLSFIDFVRDQRSRIVKIPGLWGLLFGNGESLGDRNALYFAAGPDDEKEGLFGSLRLVETDTKR